MVVRQHRRAQGLVAYGLVLAMVAVVAILGLLVFADTVGRLTSTLANTVALNV